MLGVLHSTRSPTTSVQIFVAAAIVLRLMDVVLYWWLWLILFDSGSR